MVIPLIYDYTFAFADGFSLVRQDNKYGFADKSGNIVVPLIYENAYPFVQGLASVKKDGQWSLIPNPLTAIKVTLNGSTIAFDQPPVIVSDRTLVPLRAIFEALGAQVGWDDTTQTITATKGSTSIAVQIGSTVATVNGESKTLDVPAQIVNDRTMV